jgi:hypothetical protein
LFLLFCFVDVDGFEFQYISGTNFRPLSAA